MAFSFTLHPNCVFPSNDYETSELIVVQDSACWTFRDASQVVLIEEECCPRVEVCSKNELEPVLDVTTDWRKDDCYVMRCTHSQVCRNRSSHIEPICVRQTEWRLDLNKLATDGTQQSQQAEAIHFKFCEATEAIVRKLVGFYLVPQKCEEINKQDKSVSSRYQPARHTHR